MSWEIITLDNLVASYLAIGVFGVGIIGVIICLLFKKRS